MNRIQNAYFLLVNPQNPAGVPDVKGAVDQLRHVDDVRIDMILDLLCNKPVPKLASAIVQLRAICVNDKLGSSYLAWVLASNQCDSVCKQLQEVERAIPGLLQEDEVRTMKQIKTELMTEYRQSLCALNTFTNRWSAEFDEALEPAQSSSDNSSQH